MSDQKESENENIHEPVKEVDHVKKQLIYFR